MDPIKLLQFIETVGPGAGLGLATGLLFFIVGLPLKKWIIYGQYEDMKAQRDSLEKRLDKADAEHKLEATELKTELRATQIALDKAQIMMAGAVAISRKNAHLASSLLVKLPAADKRLGAGEHEHEHDAE